MKKKSRGSKTGSRKVVLLDGAPITDLTREQLILRLERILLELEREREERVYFQAERNKLHEIWETAKQKWQETESQVLCLERDMESGNAAYRSQISEQRQRQAWLLQQHQITLTEFQVSIDLDIGVASIQENLVGEQVCRFFNDNAIRSVLILPEQLFWVMKLLLIDTF